MFNPNDLEHCGLSVNTGMYPGLVQNFMMARSGVAGESSPQGTPTTSSFYAHHNPNIKSSAAQLQAPNMFLPPGTPGLTKENYGDPKMAPPCQHTHSRSSTCHTAPQAHENKTKGVPTFDRFSNFPSFSQPVFPGIPAPQVPVLPRGYVDKMTKLSKRLDGLDQCPPQVTQSADGGTAMSQTCSMDTSSLTHVHPSLASSSGPNVTHASRTQTSHTSRSDTTTNPSCSYSGQASAQSSTPMQGSNTTGSLPEKQRFQQSSSEEVSMSSKKQGTGSKSTTKNKSHRCEKCLKDFSSKWHLERHLLTHDGIKRSRPKKPATTVKINSDKKNHICHKCSKGFSTKWHLERHLLTHEGVKGNRPKKLEPALKTNSNNKPYRCDKCAKECSSKWHLEQHLLTHEGTKSSRPKPEAKQTHKCDICGRSFSRIFLLDSHMERKHSSTEKFVCDVCDKKYADKFFFDLHHKGHFVDRPYACEECGQTFTRRDKQKRHMMIHTGEKPHVCPVCEKGFARKDKLKRHVLTHSGEKPYSCPVCGIQFSRKDRRDIHEKGHYADAENVMVASGMTKPKVEPIDLGGIGSTQSVMM